MELPINQIMNGDALTILKTLPSESINCIMTSPPYWALRDYGIKEQLGLESTFQEYINKLCDIFDEAKRVLREDGTCWVNIGDCYAGEMGKKNGWTDNKLGFEKQDAIDKGVCLTNKNKIKHELPQKCLVQIPHRFAIEMANRGWILRNTIIWHKPNCMPSSAKDRFTIDFEYLFFFVKSKKYLFETQYEPSQYEDRDKRRKYGYRGKIVGDGYRNELPNRTAEDFARMNYPDERNKRAVWDIDNRPTPYAIIEPEFRKEIIDFRDLPEHKNIREYLTEWKNKKGITIEQIESSFGNQAGHHWFEKDGSYPSKDDWIKLKELLEFDDTFDECMTTIFQKSGLKQNSPEGRIKRTTWIITTKGFSEAHFATYPEALCETPLKAGCPEGGIVLDMFFGAGTTGLVALKQGKNFIGIELNPEYIKIAENRLKPHLEQQQIQFALHENRCSFENRKVTE